MWTVLVVTTVTRGRRRKEGMPGRAVAVVMMVMMTGAVSEPASVRLGLYAAVTALLQSLRFEGGQLSFMWQATLSTPSPSTLSFIMTNIGFLSSAQLLG
jgi:hypothetical protein